MDAVCGGYLAGAELYNPLTGTFGITGSLDTARASHSATQGLILIAASDHNIGRLTSAELYNPTAGTFVSTGSLSTARNGHTATLLNTGSVLVAGGENCLRNSRDTNRRNGSHRKRNPRRPAS